MWHRNFVYQCTFDGVSRSTEYICTERMWAIEDRACFDNSSDYKMLIENEHDDALILDSVFMHMDNISSSIEAWCIPNGEQPTASNGIFEYSNNTCCDGYIAWDMTCIDDEIGCKPRRIMLYFDTDKSNATSLNPLWMNAVDLCLIPEQDGCSCPETLEPTWYPTNNPSFEPTTNNPTFEPTIYPTVEPTTNPTIYPTLDPTSRPTFQYASWFLQADGYESPLAAADGMPTCDELDALRTLTNQDGTVFVDEMPFGGFRTDLWSRIFNQIQILPPLGQFWKPSYAQSGSPFYQMYFASYQGVYISYPPKPMSSTYNPLVQPWYRAAISHPDVFVLSTPYADFSSGQLVASGAVMIRAPNSTQTFGVAAFDYQFNELLSYWNNTLSAVCQHSEGQYCYLIDSTGFMLYYDGIEDDLNDDDISYKFFGDVEPTLMQNLLDIGFFINHTHANYVENTLEASYTVNEAVYQSLQLNEMGKSFEYNSGEYTVHQITGIDLYLVFIDGYSLTNVYPNDCPDDPICPSVRSPGCITDHFGECASILMDVCSAPDNPMMPSGTCNSLNLDDNAMSILQDGVQSDFCATCYEEECAEAVDLNISHMIAPGGLSLEEWKDHSHYPHLQLCQNDKFNQAPISSADSGFDIAATCCEMDGSFGVRPDCNAHPVTYHEAVHLCKSHGYRLCTLQELLCDEISLNGSCGYDYKYNWVSDVCTGSAGTLQIGCIVFLLGPYH